MTEMGGATDLTMHSSRTKATDHNRGMTKTMTKTTKQVKMISSREHQWHKRVMMMSFVIVVDPKITCHQNV